MIEGAAGHLIVARNNIDKKIGEFEQTKRSLIAQLSGVEKKILELRQDRQEVTDGINILRSQSGKSKAE